MRKKLLRKRVLIPLLLVVVLAIAAGAAFAYYVTSTTSTAIAYTGSFNISANTQVTDTWQTTYLMPSAGVTGPYAGKYVAWRDVTLTNNGNADETVAVTALSGTSSPGGVDFNGVLHLAIYDWGWTTALVPDTLFNALNASLVAIPAGGSVSLHMALWLDSNVSNTAYAGQNMPITITFTATQS